MIAVNRGRVEPPESLIEPDGAVQREMVRAKAHYESGSKVSFDFKHYKGADVVQRLEELFHGKCAYCEYNYKAGCPVDVEHYRPKGRVQGDEGHPGYWWLASAWDNLLPSCIDCNRQRYHETATNAGSEPSPQPQPQTLYGKGDAFPIRGAVRSTNPNDDIAAEDPLLINPCVRDPANHLRWETVKESTLAIPAWQAEIEALDPYGVESIRIFGLNRKSLAEARSAKYKEAQLIGARIRKLIDRAVSRSGTELLEVLGDIDYDLGRLSELASDDKSFSAVVKGYRLELLEEMGQTIDRLMQQLE